MSSESSFLVSDYCESTEGSLLKSIKIEQNSKSPHISTYFYEMRAGLK